MKLISKGRQFAAIVGFFFLLIIGRVLFINLARMTRSVDADPALTIGLETVATVLLWLILVPVGLAIWHGTLWVINEIKAMFPQPETDRETEADGTKPQAAIGPAKDVADLVNRMRRSKAEAHSLLHDANLQITALLNVVIALQKKAVHQKRLAESLEPCLAAISSGDRQAIAKAAGQCRDRHLRQMLLMANYAVTPAWCQSAAGVINTQLAAALRWSGDYELMVQDLLEQVQQAKLGLVDVSAYLDQAEAAEPLAETKYKLAKVGQILSLPLVTGEPIKYQQLSGSTSQQISDGRHGG